MITGPKEFWIKCTKQGTLLINVTSSAGSGKTSLMEETARRLKDQIKITMYGCIYYFCLVSREAISGVFDTAK